MFLPLPEATAAGADAALAGAASPDSVVSVDASCTASFDPSLHEKTLDVLSGIQVEITNR